MSSKTRRRMLNAALIAVLIVAAVLALFPIYWMVITSVQPPADLMKYPPRFWPADFTLDHWRFAIQTRMSYFVNSLIIAFLSTFIAIVVATPSGYAFARYRVGGDTLPFWILSLRFFPAIIGAIPFFLIMQQLRLIDTYIAVVIPHLLLTIPFAVWLIKGFVAEVPRELEEAAMIDGCSHLGVIRHVTLPLIAPGLVVTSLFCFIWSWNDFVFPLILTRRQAMTLPVAIAGMREAHGLMWGPVSATAAIATLPVLVLAIILQRYLVRGLAMGAVK